jgi:two-component system chemotaxis response regulator CheY
MMRILVVDDDGKVRKAVAAMLQRAGFEVIEADGGEEALRAFREQGADLLLCDLFMPGRDGLEVIRELCREFPGVKIIAMSGGGFDGTVDMLPMAWHLGATGVLYKPFGQATLLAAVERALGAPALAAIEESRRVE